MPTKQEILDWLKKTGKSRAYLATRCGVRLPQVYNWFSKRGKIPEPKLKLIKLLMEEADPIKSPPYDFPNQDELGKFFIALSPELQERVMEEAAALNVKLSVYCSAAVEWCATTPTGQQVVAQVIEEKRDHDIHSQQHAG